MSVPKALTPAEYLALQLLAARFRLGEDSCTMPSNVRPTMRRLAQRGYVRFESGLVSLTDVGAARCKLDQPQVVDGVYFGRVWRFARPQMDWRALIWQTAEEATVDATTMEVMNVRGMIDVRRRLELAAGDDGMDAKLIEDADAVEDQLVLAINRQLPNGVHLSVDGAVFAVVDAAPEAHEIDWKELTDSALADVLACRERGTQSPDSWEPLAAVLDEPTILDDLRDDQVHVHEWDERRRPAIRQKSEQRITDEPVSWPPIEGSD